MWTTVLSCGGEIMLTMHLRYELFATMHLQLKRKLQLINVLNEWQMAVTMQRYSLSLEKKLKIKNLLRNFKRSVTFPFLKISKVNSILKEAHLIGGNTGYIFKVSILPNIQRKSCKCLYGHWNGWNLTFVGLCAVFREPLEVSRDLCLRTLAFLLPHWWVFQKISTDSLNMNM